jgi:hypothetical protein
MSSWNDILSEVERIITSDGEPVITYGRELLDLPADLPALTTIAIKTPDMIIEVRLCNEAARPPFEWVAEITLRSDDYKHYLLRTDHTVVETYGKTVTPVNETEAQNLLVILQAL